MNNLKKNYLPFLESLDELGFATFKVFEEETINQLKVLYNKHFIEKEVENLYATHNSNGAEKGIEVSHAIKNIVEEKLKEVFPNYDYFLGHFMVKGAQVEKEFALHQDWNIVDESKHKSYQIWIPLQLTYPNNGGIFLVPGSHKFFNNYRSGSYGIPVVPYQEDLEKITTNLIVPAGNILIYHNGLFHASHPNHTSEIRIAVIVNFVEKNAPTYFFQKNTVRAITELYPITGDSLIANLPDLEKGIVNRSFDLGAAVEICSVDNSKISALDLISKFQQKFKNEDAPQIKQIHIAKDRALERELNEIGYAVIDLLDSNEVKMFKDKYLSLFGNIDKKPGRFTSLQYTDPKTKKEIHEFISDNVKKAIDSQFENFVIPVSLYYTKKAFTSGDIDLHADSTLILNHQLEPHYGFWIPLIDVDENNGCLTVIPYSHKNQQAIYGGSFLGRQVKYRELLRKNEVPIHLKAGQAIIFDNNLLHNSTANKTGEDRICFTFRITHYASNYYSFIGKEKEKRDIDVYLESHDYYMNPNWDGDGNYISGKFIGTMQNGIVDFNEKELRTININNE